MIFESFSVILRQISLGVHSYAVVHFPCLTKKSFKNRDFWAFAVTLGQISLGVHSYAIAYFPCLTKKSFKNRDFGSFRRYCVKYHSEYNRTPSFIFLVLRKNPSKIETLGLCRNARSNVTRSTFARCCSFSLPYEKILQKSRFWVFSVILRQISLGVPTVRHRLFPLSYEKILQKSRLWVFSVILRQISLGVRSYAVVHFPCLTKKSFKNRDFGSLP